MVNIFQQGMQAFDQSYDRTQTMRQDRARTQAGRALAGGDRKGAMQSFGNAGMTDDVRQVQEDERVSQNDERKRATEDAAARLDFMERAATVIGRIPDDGTQAQRRAALEKLMPTFQQFIPDPAALEGIRFADLSDTGLSAFLGKVKKYQQIISNERGIFGVTPGGDIAELQKFDAKPDWKERTLADGSTEWIDMNSLGGGSAGATAGAPGPTQPNSPGPRPQSADHVVEELTSGGMAILTSGQRSADRNHRVGGVQNSWHLDTNGGLARDLIPTPGVSMAQLEQQVRARLPAGWEAINEGDHIHIEPKGSPGSYQVASVGATPPPPSGVRRVPGSAPKPREWQDLPGGGQINVRTGQKQGVPKPGDAPVAPPPESGLKPIGGGFFKDRLGRTYQPNGNGVMQQVGGLGDTEVRKTIDNITGVNTILSSLDRFDAAVRRLSPNDYGPMGKYAGDQQKYAEAKAAATDLMMTLKGPAGYNLGVITGPDMAILEGVVADPAKFDTMIRRGQVVPALTQLARSIGQKYNAEVEAFRSFGGDPAGLPKLYRSPRSHIGRSPRSGNEPGVFRGKNGTVREVR